MNLRKSLRLLPLVPVADLRFLLPSSEKQTGPDPDVSVPDGAKNRQAPGEEAALPDRIHCGHQSRPGRGPNPGGERSGARQLRGRRNPQIRPGFHLGWQKREDMKRRIPALTCLGVLLLLSCFGCQKMEEKPPAQAAVSMEAARLIRQTSAGLISVHDDITIRFNQPIDEENLEDGLLSFQPALKGELIRKDSHTLLFRPKNALPFRKSYSGVLDLDRLFPEQTQKPGIFHFTFETAGREIVSLEDDFVMEKPGSPQDLVYRGRLTLTEPAELEDIQKAVRFSENNGSIALTCEQGESAREFSFSSTSIQRDDRRRQFKLTVDKDTLELSAAFSRNVVLEPLSVFTLLNIVARTEGINPGFDLIFSDELEQAQELTGLVRVDPHLEIKTSVAGKIVTVSGPFLFGNSYQIIINKGIRSRWGTRSEAQISRQVEFGDIKPQMEFLHTGVFLPSRGLGKLYFRTVNLRAVHLDIKRVFENNIGQFLQTEQLSSKRDRRDDFNSRYISRVGVQVAEKTLAIGEEKNVWLNHALDLAALLDPSEKGPLLISLSFEREDMIYRLHGGSSRWDYSDPNSRAYIYGHGRIYKPLIISDIGLTWKAGGNEHLVFTTGLENAKPLADVQVELRSYQNQLLGSGRTDKEGRARFENVQGDAFFVSAEKDGMKSVIKANEMAWNLSSFDTEGVATGPEGTRAFLYTERGVYRPGDDIHLSAIFRNQDETFPDNHPVALKFINPRGQVAHEEISTAGLDGFYQFTLSTAESDPTGNWQAELLAGSSRFNKTIRVEMIVPFRLKVDLITALKKLDHSSRTLDCRIESRYLFGAPASGLEADLDLRLTHREQKFPSFPGFFFNNEALRFQEVKETSYQGTLDREGAADLHLKLPSFQGAPSALDLILSAGTIEKGGRKVIRREILPVTPYLYFVGLRRPEMRYGYLQVGEKHRLAAVCVDSSGRPAAGRNLTYRLYSNNRYWWWEYDSFDDFKMRYKTDAETKLISEETRVSTTSPLQFDIEADSWGQYLIEVEDAAGHKAGFFFRASMWGESGGGEDAGQLVLRADRKLYHPGEEATITLPSAPQGSLLVTVEKGDTILSANWQAPREKETQIIIPISKEMIPTAYVTVSFIQPYAQQSNDRPIRLYGILPLPVEDPATRQELDIITADNLEPNRDFSVTLQTKDRKPTRYTLAIVDEGLLDLTAFTTPDPWQGFYSKQRLGVTSYDLFNQVIGAHKGDLFRTFSIGGSEGLLMVDEDSEAGRRKRFVPVVFSTAPAWTDETGGATLSFSMPNYMGSVRIMAVSANGPRYGHAEKAVPVRSDLVLLPSLPRVLGPDEQIDIPVSLFAMSEELDAASVSLETQGPVSIIGNTAQQVRFSAADREQELLFRIRSQAAVGPARVIIKARSKNAAAVSSTDIEIRPSSPPLYRADQKTATPGETVFFTLPDDGMPGTNAARITVSAWGNLDLNRRLNYLIRYPFGCIEQTTSAVFAQLFLKGIMQMTNRDAHDVDHNINAGISALHRFQLPSGGFSFWPGQEELSTWGTNYAGHFFLEAEKLGYIVPAEMKQRWIQFQYSRALTYQDNLTTQIYRLYLLALANRPAVGPMNLILENSLKSLSNPQRWVLAAAYQLAGLARTADRLVADAGTTVKKYAEFGGTYGSSLRDVAMMLLMSSMLERREVSERLYEEIAAMLSSEQHYSTHTLGYCLLAVGNYLQAPRGGEAARIVGRINLSDGSKVPFFLESEQLVYEIEEGFGESISVVIDAETNLPRCFVKMEWEGVPLKGETQTQSHNLLLRVKYYNSRGEEIDTRDLKQGMEFWAHYQAGKTAAYRVNMEEIVLNQIFPSGWEIENFRLSGEPVPSWASGLKLEQEDYADIRDDRISWFFDLAPQTRHLDFLVKLRAVTAGSFILPPAICQAMYQDDYIAVQPGGRVRVQGR